MRRGTAQQPASRTLTSTDFPKLLISKYLSEYLIYLVVLSRHHNTQKHIGYHSAACQSGPLHHTMPSNVQHTSRKAPRRSKSIHWKAYTIMLASLLSGILLALGHHLFYSNLNGNPVVATEHVLKGVTQQQLNITIGTLFAFLVKAFLVVAVSTAYTQIVWSAIKKRATKLTTIDTMFQVTSNIWSFLSFSIWWKYPLLLLLACTVW